MDWTERKRVKTAWIQQKRKADKEINLQRGADAIITQKLLRRK
jgi:hypothetical protein